MALEFLEFPWRQRTGWCKAFVPGGYHIPFHHQPVSREPIKFLSYGLRSVKAQALQGGVDKMLEKGFLELIDCPCLGNYSRLFLAQKGMVVGIP